MKLAFRLFPWHVGALNACRAFNFAAAPGKFARKLAARPTASAECGQKNEAFLRLLIFGSGGLGLRRRDGGKAEDSAIYRCSRGAFIHDFHRRTSKATAGSARTRLGN